MSQLLNRTALVITTINEPNDAIRQFAKGCVDRQWPFYVVGDRKGPASFECSGASFHSLQDQLNSGFGYALACPQGHYARKNIGYLLAMRDGADVIVETDDDNFPLDGFWSDRSPTREVLFADQAGWLNVYAYYSEHSIWPRGFPLAELAKDPSTPILELASKKSAYCPIQQGLADENPDVDAIYRLLMPLPQFFKNGRPVALGQRVWCPFNSQNTTWWKEAFPLLYLPATCSFRMTDIWRSFVAQRVAWELGWSVLFEGPTVFQRRNEHDLMRDFSDEIPGYLHNGEIARILENLNLTASLDAIANNVRVCYEALVARGLLERDELTLLDRWFADIQSITGVPNITNARPTPHPVGASLPSSES